MTGVDVDPTGQKICWSDGGVNAIRRAVYYGTNIATLISGQSSAASLRLDSYVKDSSRAAQ